MKPPFTYFGGKTAIAERIAALLPPHEHYVEPFAGSLAVLLAKRPAPMETVNDLDQDLVTFWRVLRDDPEGLERVCALTPHSRGEHQAALRPGPELSDLERARMVWVKLTQGRGGQPRQRTGWRHHQSPGQAPMSDYLAGYVARMPPAARRLMGVALECRPAIEVIEAYGQHAGVLIYADPPYLDSTRSHGGYGDMYNAEMRWDADHRLLAKTLQETLAAVVLSGYDSPLYAELYDGWHRLELLAQAGNGLQRRRTEVLWSNRPFPAQQRDLFAAETAAP